MHSPTPENVLPPRVLVGAWCAAIFRRMRAFGVSDVVISPGSRSTPLTVAALRDTELQCHSVVDERSAGFFALGLARASQKPVALVCTSGTAAAHYFPALIEASYDGVPFFVVSADRPEELQNCGAPQTIAQGGLFGAFVRQATSLTAPTETLGAFALLAQSVDDLLRLATSERPGPVHLNVPLRKPLEPEEPQTEQQRARVLDLFGAGSASSHTTLINPLPDIEHLVEARRSARRPLLTAGPLPPADMEHVLASARLLKSPLLQEYGPLESAGLEFAGPLLRGAAEPDLIVHFGPPAVSSRWSSYIEEYRGRYIVFSGTEFRDPSRRAERVVVAPLSRVSEALGGALASRGASFDAASDFLAPFLLRTREAVQSALRTSGLKIAGSSNSDLVASTRKPRLHEPLAVSQILSACSANDALVLGNSLSLRLASWIWPAGGRLPQPYTARGVNGIDGMVAWSLGVAQATGRPTLALLGDVTAAHDVGSLQLLTQRQIPLVLVVLDNSGGRIFDHLPLGARVSSEEMAYFTTPPRVDWGAAAKAFFLEHFVVSSHEELKPLVAEALSKKSASLIVVPTDSNTSSAFLAELRETLLP